MAVYWVIKPAFSGFWLVTFLVTRTLIMEGVRRFNSCAKLWLKKQIIIFHPVDLVIIQWINGVATTAHVSAVKWLIHCMYDILMPYEQLVLTYQSNGQDYFSFCKADSDDAIIPTRFPQADTVKSYLSVSISSMAPNIVPNKLTGQITLREKLSIHLWDPFSMVIKDWKLQSLWVC